jgi:hypothetical protein
VGARGYRLVADTRFALVVFDGLEVGATIALLLNDASVLHVAEWIERKLL